MGRTSPVRIELPGIYCEFICGCSMKIGKVDLEEFKKRSVRKIKFINNRNSTKKT